MKALRFILVVLVLLGIGRIGWGFVETGDIVNPLEDVKRLVLSVNDSLDNTVSVTRK